MKLTHQSKLTAWEKQEQKIEHAAKKAVGVNPLNQMLSAEGDKEKEKQKKRQLFEAIRDYVRAAEYAYCHDEMTFSEVCGHLSKAITKIGSNESSIKKAIN